MADVFEVIYLQGRPGLGDPCGVEGCKNLQSGFHAVPVFNGDIVSTEWTGDWCGIGCCESCYERHARGEMETSDDLYQGVNRG